MPSAPNDEGGEDEGENIGEVDVVSITSLGDRGRVNWSSRQFVPNPLQFDSQFINNRATPPQLDNYHNNHSDGDYILANHSSKWYENTVLDGEGVEEIDLDGREHSGQSLVALALGPSPKQVGDGNQQLTSPFNYLGDVNEIEDELFMDEDEVIDSSSAPSSRQSQGLSSPTDSPRRPPRAVHAHVDVKLKQNLVELVNRLEDARERISALSQENKELRKAKLHLEKRQLVAQTSKREGLVLDLSQVVEQYQEENNGFITGEEWTGAARQQFDMGEYADGRTGQHKTLIYLNRLRKWITAKISLFKKDCETIEARFGGGVAAYFKLFRWQALVGLAASIIVISIHIPHLVRVFSDAKTNGVFRNLEWSDLAGIPFFLTFQSYDYALYTAMSFTMILFFCISLMYQIIAETKVQSEHAVRSKDMEHKRYSKLLLNCWNHSQTDQTSVRDQRFVIAQSLRILLEESKRMEAVSSRSFSEKAVLITRKIVGNIILLVAFTIAIGSLVIIRQFDSFIQTKIAQSINIDVWPSWIPFKQLIHDNIASALISIAIVVINFVTPTITQYVTDFEKWDAPTTALRILVLRYYLLRIATTVILLYQFSVLLDSIKGGSSKCQSVLDVSNQVFFVILSAIAYEFSEPIFMIIKYLFHWVKAKILTFQLRRGLKKQLNDKCVVEGSNMNLASNKVVPDSLQSTTSSASASDKPEESIDHGELITEIRVEKEEFQTAPRLMSLIYLQTIMWMTLIFFPFGIVLIGVSNLILFKYQKFFVLWLLKKPKSPIDARTQSGFFSVLYAISFVVIAASYYYMFDLHHVWGEDCGPLTQNETMIESLEKRLKKRKIGTVLVFVFDHVITNSALVWFLVGGMIVVYFWRSYSMNTMAAYVSILSKRLLGEQKVYEEKLLLQQHENEILRSRLEQQQKHALERKRKEKIT